MQLFVAFFMMILLTLFQSSYKGSAGVTAIAALIFVIFFVGMLAVAGYACFYRLRLGHYESEPIRLHFERKKKLKIVPWVGTFRTGQKDEDNKTDEKISAGSIPWWHVYYVDHDPERVTVHDDEDYTRKFGWLASRFRRTRWWFFAVWLIYEFIRACFYGGAAANPPAQVFGLLVVEIIAFVALLMMKPFEGQRLNTLVVYLLGASKVLTTGLSAAFLTSFNLARIPATIIGVMIIIIQGVLTIVLMIAIVVGAITSYMSLTRNREEFKPKSWGPRRTKYFNHIAKRAADLPPEPAPESEGPIEPYFNVSSVRRCPKIEDEDEDFIAEINDPSASRLSVNKPFTRSSRRNSTGGNSIATFTTVPWGARVHRASWSTRDFETMPEQNGAQGSDSTTRPGTQASMAALNPATDPSASTTSLGTARPKTADGNKHVGFAT